MAPTVVLNSAASPANLNTSTARSKTRAPPANRFTRYAPTSPSSVLPAAMPSDVASEPAVVMFTTSAPAKIAGQAR